MTLFKRFIMCLLFTAVSASQALATYPQRVVAVQDQNIVFDAEQRSTQAYIAVGCIDPRGNYSDNPAAGHTLVRTSSEITVEYVQNNEKKRVSLLEAIDRGIVAARGDGSFWRLRISRGTDAPAGEIGVTINSGTVFGFRDGRALNAEATSRAGILCEAYREELRTRGVTSLNDIERRDFLRVLYARYTSWE